MDGHTTAALIVPNLFRRKHVNDAGFPGRVETSIPIRFIDLLLDLDRISSLHEEVAAHQCCLKRAGGALWVVAHEHLGWKRKLT